MGCGGSKEARNHNNVRYVPCGPPTYQPMPGGQPGQPMQQVQPVQQVQPMQQVQPVQPERKKRSRLTQFGMACGALGSIAG
jgi:hypothetical protein